MSKGRKDEIDRLDLGEGRRSPTRSPRPGKAAGSGLTSGQTLAGPTTTGSANSASSRATGSSPSTRQPKTPGPKSNASPTGRARTGRTTDTATPPRTSENSTAAGKRPTRRPTSSGSSATSSATKSGPTSKKGPAASTKSSAGSTRNSSNPSSKRERPSSLEEIRKTLRRPTTEEAEKILEAARRTPFTEQTERQRALFNLAHEVLRERNEALLEVVNRAKTFVCAVCARPATLHRDYQFEGGCAGFRPTPEQEEEYWAFILELPEGFSHTPHRPPEGRRVEDYWPPPVMVDMADETVPRRDAMAARVMRFVWASRARDPELEANWRFGPDSYRRVLAARALSEAIESYAVKWRGPLTEPAEGVLEERVKAAAKAYVEAHHELPGRFRGSVEMTYPEYAAYCRMFGLREGHLIHEEPGRKVAA